MSDSPSDLGPPSNEGLPTPPDGPSKIPMPDDRSAQAKAAAWVSKIITISIEMVVPGLAGYWLDGKLGTKFVFMLVGFAGGVTFAIRHLLELTKVNKPIRPVNTGHSKSKERKEQQQ